MKTYPVKSWLKLAKINLTARTKVYVNEIDDVGQIHFMLKSDSDVYQHMKKILEKRS